MGEEDNVNTTSECFRHLRMHGEVALLPCFVPYNFVFLIGSVSASARTSPPCPPLQQRVKVLLPANQWAIRVRRPRFTLAARAGEGPIPLRPLAGFAKIV